MRNANNMSTGGIFNCGACLITLMSLGIASATLADSVDDIPAGHWYEVPNSRLVDVSWTDNPNMILPWNGGILDDTRNRLVLWGGGHANYHGNELYAFDLDTLSWEQLTDPTPLASIPDQNDNEVYPDGRPASRHTYNGLVYLPSLDKMWSSGGSTWWVGQCFGGTWLYDFNASPPESGWENIPYDQTGCSASADYDPNTGKIWYASRDKLYEYDPLTTENPWTLRYSGQNVGQWLTGRLDPIRQLFIFIGRTNNAERNIFAYDVSDPDNVRVVQLTTTGANEIEGATFPGLAYDRSRGLLVAWSGEPDSGLDPRNIYTLDLDTKVWTRHEPAAGNKIIPTLAANTGTYVTGTFGRFRYSPADDVFVLVNAYDENVYLYRLDAESGSTVGRPVISLSASPVTVNQGESAQITWSTQNANECQSSGDWMATGSVPLSGTENTGPLQANAKYNLTCSGPAGTETKTVLVSVNALPNTNATSSELSSGSGGGGSVGLFLLLGLTLLGFVRRKSLIP